MFETPEFEVDPGPRLGALLAEVDESGLSTTNQADHTIPWPHGTTTIDNLSPPCMHHHNAKTHGRWQLHQPINGIYL